MNNIQLDKNQKFNIPLKKIVPEYYSKNPVVKWLFKKRMYIVLKYLEIIKTDTLIDMGCGDGSLLQLINERGIKIRAMWGIDLNQKVVQLESQIKNCNFRVQNILKTDFQNCTFDVVICLDILEHMKDIKMAIIEIKRILKDNSHLIISSPVESTLYKLLRFIIKGSYSQATGPGAGKHYYNARQLNKIILQMGFTRVSLKKIPTGYPFDLFHIGLYKK